MQEYPNLQELLAREEQAEHYFHDLPQQVRMELSRQSDHVRSFRMLQQAVHRMKEDSLKASEDNRAPRTNQAK